MWPLVGNYIKVEAGGQCKGHYCSRILSSTLGGVRKGKDRSSTVVPGLKIPAVDRTAPSPCCSTAADTVKLSTQNSGPCDKSEWLMSFGVCDYIEHYFH